MLTPDEWWWVLRGLSLAAWLLLVWMLWRRDRRDRQVDQHEADIAALWRAVFPEQQQEQPPAEPEPEPRTAPIVMPAPAAPEPEPDGPATAEADPADTFARQQYLQAHPTRGRHRR